MTAEGRKTTYRIEKLPTEDIRFTNIGEDRLATVTLQQTNGTTRTVSTDGTVTTSVSNPDPRFGMQAPLSDVTVRRPGGLTSNVKQFRTVTQISGLQVTGLTDSVVINGRSYKTVYNGKSVHLYRFEEWRNNHDGGVPVRKVSWITAFEEFSDECFSVALWWIILSACGSP